MISRAQLLAILVGGMVAGAVDIGAASIIFHADPVVILRAVASGFLGSRSFHGGMASATLGAASQIGISIVAAAVYVLAAGWFPILLRQAFVGGLVFGTCSYFVMNDVVVPLSNAAPNSHWNWMLFAENMIAMFVYGWIIAFTAQRFLAARAHAPA